MFSQDPITGEIMTAKSVVTTPNSLVFSHSSERLDIIKQKYRQKQPSPTPLLQIPTGLSYNSNNNSNNYISTVDSKLKQMPLSTQQQEEHNFIIAHAFFHRRALNRIFYAFKIGLIKIKQEN